MIDSPLPAALAVDTEPFGLDAVDDFDDEVGEPARRWRIEDDGGAEWAMRHYAESAAEWARIELQAQDWRDRIDEWEQEATNPHRRRAAFFEGHLHDYALRIRDASGDAVKTVVLPTGRVKTTMTRPRVEVGDAGSFENWAAANPDDELVRTKYSLAAAATKDRIKIWEDQVGVRWTIRMDCTHVATGTKMFEAHTLGRIGGPGSEEDPPKVGESWGCHDCADPIAGPAQSRVEHVESEELIELVARDAATGELIPWATVAAGSVSAKVVVG